MNYTELFGIRKLRCPKCNNTQMFYVGHYKDGMTEPIGTIDKTHHL